MWITRELNFNELPTLEESVLLRASVVQSLQQCDDVLSRAQLQHAEILVRAESLAAEIIAKAEAQAEVHASRLLAEKEAQFLQRTGALFADWHAARLQQEENLVQQARELVHATLEHLFAQSTEAQKTTALLRQLLHAGAREADATLCCSSQHYADADAWLQSHPHLSWALKCDDTLPADSLLLQTASGELNVAWPQLQQRLLITIQT